LRELNVAEIDAVAGGAEGVVRLNFGGIFVQSFWDTETRTVITQACVGGAWAGSIGKF
jgi:hypothetical protein